MNAIWTITGALALLTAGAAVPVDDGTAVEALMEQFEDAVNQAAEDVRFLPLEPSSGYGRTSDGSIHRVELLVRVSAPIELDDLLILYEGRAIEPTIEYLRGDAADGAERGDLVRIDFDLDLAGGKSAQFMLESPGARAAQWGVAAPKNLAPEMVKLQVNARTL